MGAVIMSRRMIPDDATVGLWRLDESGVATAVNIANPGTYDGTPTGASGVVVSADEMPWDTARNFVRASSQYITIPYNAAFDLASFTVECWIKPTSNITGSNFAVFVGCWITGNDGWMLYKRNNDLYAALAGYSGGNRLLNTGPSVPADVGNWTYLAMTNTGTTTELYHNGTLFDSLTVGSPITYNAQPIIIGADPALVSHHDGEIAEVRYSNRVRKPWEIYQTWAAVQDPVAGLKP